MKIGTYGSKVFTVSDNSIYTFGAVSRSSSYTTDEQENGSKKPKVKNKAPGVDTLSFPLELRADSVNVRKEVEDWISMQGESHYFIVGKENYGKNKWKLVGVDVSNQEFGPGGILKKASLNLSFKENAYTKKNNSTAQDTRNTNITLSKKPIDNSNMLI